MNKLFSPVLLFVSIFFFVACNDNEESRPLLHPLFSDHAVLQRGQVVPVWGWAEPGTGVTVQFAGQIVRATTGPDGRWTASLQPMLASSEGRSLEVTTDDPQRSAEAHDVLVGDVWLCSGQSNMEMGITGCNEEEEIASADYPSIRLLNIPQKTALQTEELFSAGWARCSPQALRESGDRGGFSATAYFFGKHLHQELGIPIGLIHSSWGGTQSEGWTSAPALAAFPSFQDKLEEVAAIADSTADHPEQDYLKRWFMQHDPGTQKGWGVDEADTSDWRDVTLPGWWADCGIRGFEGVVWAQRTVELPEDWAGQKLVVELGEISDNDTTWLNGKVIGDTIGFGKPRTYSVPAGQSQAGQNTITLRVVNAGGGAILAEGHPMRIYPVGHSDEAISLAGTWELQETAKKAVPFRSDDRPGITEGRE